MATSYFDTDLAKDCLKGFMMFQKPDGMFPDVVYLSGNMVDSLTKPPVLPWSAITVYERDQDQAFLAEAYERFIMNEKFWTTRRMYEGLFHYYSEGTPEEVAKNDYLFARYESGWDNSPRWDAPVIHFWPIDLNCFMITFYRSMAKIANALGKDCKEWEEKEAILTSLVHERLWDAEKQCFADYNFESGRFSGVITPASFMPLFIGIATDSQAEAMHKIASDPNRFFPGMPSVSYDDPTYSTGYWRGPTWLNIAYFAAKGLKQYGFTETADAIREYILSMVDENKDGIYENYNSKERKGLYWHAFSWSACFVIEFIVNW
jgi:putative isomerase